MDTSLTRKQRLTRLLNLAQAYKGWNRRELAKALGRDPTKLIPQSGNPKLDLVVDLAEVLDWTVGDVAESVWVNNGEKTKSNQNQDFDELDREAIAAHRAGEYQKMVNVARQAWLAAKSSQERALACNREAGGWDGLGRFTSMVDAVQRGLQEPTIDTDVRLMLQSNLSNAHYSLGHLFEARATSRELIIWYDENPPQTRRDRWTHAYAYYVRGNTLRQLVRQDRENARHHAERAHQDLKFAGQLFVELAEEFGNEQVKGIANTCNGGLIELAVELGECTPQQALAALQEGLTAYADSDTPPVGDWLESYGWWCIFGCNIALQYLSEKDLQQQMAVFTNIAGEIASRLDNWTMRERVLTMEYARRQKLVDWTGIPSTDWAIDSKDVQVIVGTMGRFPMFHRTGWKILETARIVRDN